MLPLKKIFSPGLTLCKNEEIKTRKQALEQASRLVQEINDEIHYQEVLAILQHRERLGSTAVGHGIAIPHGKIPHLELPVCILFSLKEPISFSESGPCDIDLIFTLLVPEKADEQHLNILGKITEKLKSPDYRKKLREAETNADLYEYAVDE